MGARKTDVSSWHLSDIAVVSLKVCFRGQSRHQKCDQPSPLMTPKRTLHYLASLGVRLFDLTNLRCQAPVRTNGLCATTFSLPPLRLNIKLFTMGKWARSHDALACCHKAANYRISCYLSIDNACAGGRQIPSNDTPKRSASSRGLVAA